jgi:hypothetical protein
MQEAVEWCKQRPALVAGAAVALAGGVYLLSRNSSRNSASVTASASGKVSGTRGIAATIDKFSSLII